MSVTIDKPVTAQRTKFPCAVPYDGPVCAGCKHKREPKSASAQPHEWYCAQLSTEVERPACVDPVSGVTSPPWIKRVHCMNVNDDGQCTLFEAREEKQATERGEREPVAVTHRKARWYERLIRRKQRNT